MRKLMYIVVFCLFLLTGTDLLNAAAGTEEAADMVSAAVVDTRLVAVEAEALAGGGRSFSGGGGRSFSGGGRGFSGGGFSRGLNGGWPGVCRRRSRIRWRPRLRRRAWRFWTRLWTVRPWGSVLRVRFRLFTPVLARVLLRSVLVWIFSLSPTTTATRRMRMI